MGRLALRRPAGQRSEPDQLLDRLKGVGPPSKIPRVASRLLGSALRGRFWIFTTRWSVQPLPEPKKLVDHYADSQQHQQRHDDGRTHSLIIPLGWRAELLRLRLALTSLPLSASWSALLAGMDGASTGALPTRAPLMPSRMLVGTTCSCGRHITWLCECGAVASGRRYVVRYGHRNTPRRRNAASRPNGTLRRSRPPSKSRR